MSTLVEVEIQAVTMTCGHTVFMDECLAIGRRRDHRNFYCTVCGQANHWPQKSDLDKLRGQLASKQDMLDTVRAERDRAEYQRRAEKAAKTKLKKRIAAGVCPCCNRTFKQLSAHMQRQHPEYAHPEPGE
jgi:hypothetical protein